MRSFCDLLLIALCKLWFNYGNRVSLVEDNLRRTSKECPRLIRTAIWHDSRNFDRFTSANKCMLFSVKWTQFYLEEKAMCAISLFYTEGGSLEERKTPRFLIYIPFFCLGRYLHMLNLTAFVYTCLLVCKLTIYWIVKYLLPPVFVCITEEESMGYITT